MTNLIKIIKFLNTAIFAMCLFFYFHVSLSASTGSLKWKFDTEEYIESSPALSNNGTIYVGSGDNKLYAVNSDGTKKWEFETGSSVISSPALTGDVIYFGSNDGYLYAVNSDGSLKWKFKTEGGIYGSSPAIAQNGTIYIGSDDHYLYAVNPDGTLKWKFKTGDWIWSSPVIGSDETIYVGSDDGYLYAVNSDGTLKWKFKTENKVGSSPAIGSDGTVYTGSWDSYLYAVNPDGTLKWKFKTDDAIYDSSPVISFNGVIYIGSKDGYLYAVNSDGTLKWKFKTDASIYDSSPLIASDGTVYFGSWDSYLYAVNPDGTLKWKYKTGKGLYGSSPVMSSDGTLYFGSGDGSLYALGTDSSGLEADSWPMFHLNVSHTGYYSLQPTGECSSSTLLFCNEKEACIEANGYWYNNSCNEEPLTSVLSVIATPSTGFAPVTVNFIINNPDNITISNYEWKIDNSSLIDSNLPTTEHTFETEGEYTVTCEVTVNNENITLTRKLIINQNIEEFTEEELKTTIIDGAEKIDNVSVDNETGSATIVATPENDEIVVKGKDYTFNIEKDLAKDEKASLTTQLIDWAYSESENILEKDVENALTKPIKKPFKSGSTFKTESGKIKPESYILIDKQNSKTDLTIAVTQYMVKSAVPLWKELEESGYVILSGADIAVEDSFQNKLVWENIKDNITLTLKAFSRKNKIGSLKSGKEEIKLFYYNSQLNQWEDSKAAIEENEDYFTCSDYSLNRLAPYIFVYNSVCSSENIGSCYDESSCIEAGGYWYNNLCNKTKDNSTFGTKKWEFVTGDVISSSPAIDSDGTIYIGSWDGKLYAITPDGTLKWSFQAGNWIVSSPAIDSDGNIYFGSGDGKLYSLNPDGTLNWSFQTDNWISSSPAIDSDGNIFFGAGNGTLYSLNPDGSINWSFQADDWIVSSPAIDSNGNIYFGAGNGKLYAVNHEGTLKWKFTTNGEIKSSPAINSDGTIYIGSWDGKLYAVNPNGTLKWTFTTEGAVKSSPAIDSDGTVYIGSDDKKLYAVNPDGSKKWEFEIRDLMFSSPAIGSDGNIYVGSDSNYLFAINSKGKLLWKFQTDDYMYSSPVIASDGTIYIGAADNKLYAVISGAQGLKNTPWPMFRHDVNHTGNYNYSVTPFTILSIETGWNLKSIPVKTSGAVSPESIFNNSSISTIWKWNSGSWAVWSLNNNIKNLISSYGLSSISELTMGEGFWINSSNDLKVSFNNNGGGYGLESLSVNNGWNLKGIGKDVPSSDFNKLGDISTLWKWSGNNWKVWSPKNNILQLIKSYGISIVNNLNAGDGFWINK